MGSLDVRNDTSKQSSEIYVYDVIGSGWLGDGGITPSDVADALKKTSGAKTLNVRINSPGGDLFAGHAIYSLFQTSGRRINVEIDGIAASAASIIAMVGDSIRMAEGAQIMIHQGFSERGGTSAEMRKQADLLDTLNAQIVAIYAARTRQSAAAITKMMDDETWMTAEEALRLGFATEITRAKRLAASVDVSQFPYRNVPQELRGGSAEAWARTSELRKQIDALKREDEIKRLRRQIDAARSPAPQSSTVAPPKRPALGVHIDRDGRHFRAALHEAGHVCESLLTRYSDVEDARIGLDASGRVNFGHIPPGLANKFVSLAGAAAQRLFGFGIEGIEQDVRDAGLNVESQPQHVMHILSCVETDLRPHRNFIRALAERLWRACPEPVKRDEIHKLWQEHCA